MSLSTGWIQHIEAWQRSGLKQAAYCRQQTLNYHTFSARLCDYRKIQKISRPALIPVQVETSATGSIVLKHA
ncbi:MAG: IS66 family insertion sequence element accessory protein TnpA, partial [Methylobacter sp.]